VSSKRRSAWRGAACVQREQAVTKVATSRRRSADVSGAPKTLDRKAAPPTMAKVGAFATEVAPARAGTAEARRARARAAAWRHGTTTFKEVSV